MFNDEIDILKFRISYYSDIVDKFIVAESKTTFSGKKKPLYAEDVFKRLGVHTTNYQIIEYQPDFSMIQSLHIDRWPLERYARATLSSEIRKLSPSDTVMLSDVDEIASTAQIQKHRKVDKIVSLSTPLTYRKANWLSIQGKDWSTFKIGPAEQFIDLNEIRYRKTFVEKKSPGLHISYLSLTTADIVSKSSNSAHREHEIDTLTAEHLINLSDKFQIDHLGRFDRKGFGLLSVISYEELNEVGQKFYEKFPEYFDFSKSPHGTVIRIAASQSVSKAWRLGINSAPIKIQICDLIFAIPVRYLGVSKKFFFRILKKFKNNHRK